MTRVSRSPSLGASTALLALLLASSACRGEGATDDLLAAEVERSSHLLQSKPKLKQDNQPVLDRAAADLRDGRRMLALQRLANLRVNVATAAYLSERPADQLKNAAAFEAEWQRLGGAMRDDLAIPSPDTFGDVRPAAARALGEVALLQVRGFYHASLDYGRATMPEMGVYYLAKAEGQRDLAAFARTFSGSARPEPPLRSLRPELDALEAEMLAVYRPPVSIERHGEFIGASATLKEARELDAAGLRHGALLRYLTAAQQFAPLRKAAPPADADILAKRLQEHAERLSARDADHSIGQLFLEMAQAEQANPTAGAVTIANDVLPRYLAALEPAPPEPQRPDPRVTVTLVRWPYT